MDKASRAIRRSGVKLLSLSGGHSDLNVLVSDIKDIKNCAKAFMNAQHLASQDMSRWASHEENRAVQDVVSNVADLLLVWTEVQKTFIGNLKDYRQMYEMILEGEKHVTQAKDNLDYCQEKEMKVRKEMKKVAKRASAIELRILQSRVEMAEKAREVAEAEVSERVRENEAVKLIRLKEGLLKVSGAYMELANQCNTIFMAERDVALQLPDVHGRELERIRYSGVGTTRFIVEKAKEAVQSYTSSDVSSDPPPPYTPPVSSSKVTQQTNSAVTSDVSRRSSGPSRVQTSEIYDTPQGRPCSGQHRHSLPYDTRPAPASNTRPASGSRNESDFRPRSRSDNNMCHLDTASACSDMPNSQSRHSLPNYSMACSDQGIVRENSGNSLSSQGISIPAQSVSSADNLSSSQGGISQSAISEEPAETSVHTNVVQTQQVVGLPPLEASSTKTREDLGQDYSVDSTIIKRTAVEHSSSEAGIGDEFQFADEDECIPKLDASPRPIPAPRQKCSGQDSNEGYTTAEEGQEPSFGMSSLTAWLDPDHSGNNLA